MPSREADIPISSNQTGIADAKEFSIAQGQGKNLAPPCVPGPSCLPPTCGTPPPCRGCQPTCAPRPCRGKEGL